MRTYVHSATPWVRVSTQSSTGPTWYSTDTTTVPNHLGDIRWNTSTHSYEIWDGSYWLRAPADTVTVSLGHETERALEWARRRMLKDEEREQRMQNNPALRAA